MSFMQMPEMSHPSMLPHHLIRTIQDCEVTCEHMITMLTGYDDVQERRAQILYLRDCASICQTMVTFLARRSPFAKSLAGICAYICEVCGHECAKFSDHESQHCSQVCMNCARECRAFSMAG